MAASYNSISDLHSNSDRPAEALAALKKALAIDERLLHDNREWPDFAASTGLTLGNIGLIDLKLQRFDKARETLIQAVELGSKALAANPNSPHLPEDTPGY